MKYLDFPIGQMNRAKKNEVDRLTCITYDQNEIDLRFPYERSGEERDVRLSLSREEAIELMGELKEFLEDDSWASLDE